jgi:hypothetical protein
LLIRFWPVTQRLPTLSFIAVRDDLNLSQRNFASSLLDPELPVPVDVTGTPKKRYAVYRNNVTVSLVRAMESNFPAIRKLLGETYFAGLAREFVQQNPPQSPLLFSYGDNFAVYLEGQADLQDYPYLPDVARLEQFWRQSYHELDAACLAPEALAAFSSDEIADLRLTPHPALRLMTSQHPVRSIFQANREEGMTLDVSLDQPEHVIVSRPNYDVMLLSVNNAAYLFIKALKENRTFGEAADAAFAVDEDFDLADCIANILLSGAFQPLKKQG